MGLSDRFLVLSGFRCVSVANERVDVSMTPVLRGGFALSRIHTLLVLVSLGYSQVRVL